MYIDYILVLCGTIITIYSGEECLQQIWPFVDGNVNLLFAFGIIVKFIEILFEQLYT